MNQTVRPILLVEDDPNDVLLIRRALVKSNVTASLQVLHDGGAAVAYLEGHGAYADRARYPLPAFLLLDLKLPRKSGFEILRWIQTHKELPSPPIVVLTADGKPSTILRAYDLGACSYYVKPTSFRGLLELVKALRRDFPDLLGFAEAHSLSPSTSKSRPAQR